MGCCRSKEGVACADDVRPGVAYEEAQQGASKHLEFEEQDWLCNLSEYWKRDLRKKLPDFATDGLDPETRGRKEAEWRELGGEELEEALAKGWIRLVSAAWLVRLALSGGRLARRQDLPEEAFVGVDALKATGKAVVRLDQVGQDRLCEYLPVLVVSYPWLQPHDPDPHGETLQLLAAASIPFLKECGPHGFLMDFSSLPQYPRTEQEEADFKAGLPSLNTFYSHAKTVVLKVTRFPSGYPGGGAREYDLPPGANTTAYGNRGWCYAEECMSGLVKNRELVLDLGSFKAALPLGRLITSLSVGRQPPSPAEEFKQELDAKTFTSKKDDFERVKDLYQKAYDKRICQADCLHFPDLNWSHAHVAKLVKVLPDALRLRLLNLQGNRLGDRGTQELAKVLEDADSTLQDLDVANNGIGDEGAKALAEGLKRNSTLQELSVANNGIGDEGAKALGEGITANGALKSLILSTNGIGKRGAAALAEGLKKNGTLKELRLGANRIGGQGGKALAEALKVNGALEVLRLSNTGIGDQGAKGLAEVLKESGALKILDLGCTQMKDRGAKALAEGLKKSSTLKELHLPDNQIGDEGARALAEGLRENGTMEVLALSGNRLGDRGVRALAEALKDNRALAVLELLGIEIHDQGHRWLEEAKQINGKVVVVGMRGI